MKNVSSGLYNWKGSFDYQIWVSDQGDNRDPNIIVVKVANVFKKTYTHPWLINLILS